MECPVCGYDNMDAVADEGGVKYTCPECEEVMAEQDMSEYTINDALKDLVEGGYCPSTPPIMGELLRSGYFDAVLNGMTSKEFYQKWLTENDKAETEE